MTNRVLDYSPRGRDVVLIVILFCAGHIAIGVADVYAGQRATDTKLAEGIASFERGEYERALERLQALQSQYPHSSDYAMWVARAYGRLAEESNWLRALEYARQTHQYLELAVRLDPDNEEALSDLEQYYAQAPSFLGGSTTKAEQVRQRLSILKAKRDGHS